MKNLLVLLLIVLCFTACKKSAEPVLSEKLSRGVVSLQIDEKHSYVGWRLLKEDPSDAAFNVYRLRVGDSAYMKVNASPVSSSTNFIDETAEIGQAYRYKVRILKGAEEIETPGQGYVYMMGLAERERAGESAPFLNRPYISVKL